MNRRIDAFLKEWEKDGDRGVLLMRGARQVGKTYSVRQLGAAFPHFLEVNFEEKPDVQVFFSGSLDPSNICEKLSGYYGVPVVPGKTLLFLDEIQACPRALSALRFFHEKRPDLHVVAAGSLLESALQELPSHGVGRIQNLFMYPMSFREFLVALGEEKLLELTAQADASRPVDEPFHRRLVDYVRTYQLVGGMPAVVASYVRHRDLNRCMGLLDSLLVTLRDDFAKYKKRAPVERLAEVFRSISFQAGCRFTYARVDSQSSQPPIKQALDMLIRAGLAHKVLHTAARGIPLGAQAEPARFKVLPLDIGLHQRCMGLDMGSHLVAGPVELVNKGSLAEVLVGRELIAEHSPRTEPSVFYWHREARGSQAEVDYVVALGERIVPIEVKAGTTGRMRSLHLFLEERGADLGIRVSLENFSRYGHMETVPLYAAWRLGTPSGRPSCRHG
jgi:predicted AAA+ superfamily ATPase